MTCLRTKYGCEAEVPQNAHSKSPLPDLETMSEVNSVNPGMIIPVKISILTIFFNFKTKSNETENIF